MSGPVMLGAGKPPGFDDPEAFLRHFHRRVRAQLAVIDRAVAPEVPTTERLSALRGSLAFFGNECAMHERDEEESVLPRLPAEATDEVHAAHEELRLLLHTFARAAIAAPAEELTMHAAVFRAACAEHLELEERLLFPLLRDLPAADRRAIGMELQARRGEL